MFSGLDGAFGIAGPKKKETETFVIQLTADNSVLQMCKRYFLAMFYCKQSRHNVE